MKKTEKKDLRIKSIKELEKILKEKRKDFEKIRMEKGAGRVKNTHLLTLKRKEIAAILTIITEKRFQEAMKK